MARHAGIATAPMDGARRPCRSPRRNRRATRRAEAATGRRSETALHRLRIAPQPRLEPHRRLAGVSHGALRVLKSLGDEGEALLEIGAARRIIARGIRRDPAQRLAGAGSDVRQLVLTAAEILQSRDDLGTLAVRLVE